MLEGLVIIITIMICHRGIACSNVTRRWWAAQLGNTESCASLPELLCDFPPKLLSTNCKGKTTWSRPDAINQSISLPVIHFWRADDGRRAPAQIH